MVRSLKQSRRINILRIIFLLFQHVVSFHQTTPVAIKHRGVRDNKLFDAKGNKLWAWDEIVELLKVENSIVERKEISMVEFECDLQYRAQPPREGLFRLVSRSSLKPQRMPLPESLQLLLLLLPFESII